MQWFLMIFFLLLSWIAQTAQAAQTSVYCDQVSPQICAYLDFQTPPTTNKLAEYEVVFQLQDAETSVDQLDIEMIWLSDELMINSIPGKIQKINSTVYKAEKALLMLKGDWVIYLYPTINGQRYEIQVPLQM